MSYEDRFGPYEILICHKSEVLTETISTYNIINVFSP